MNPEEFSSEDYFNSYNDGSVHQLMLSDIPRMTFYRNVLSNIRDKVVVDVGAGSGILSLFAARGGAKRVYALEASPLSTTLEEIVAANGYSHVIEVIPISAEDWVCQSQRPHHVDVIVSEWMGFYLLHENMLPSVLKVRDAYPMARLIPDKANITCAPITLTPHITTQTSFWAQGPVDGFDMRCMEHAHRKQLLTKIQNSNPFVECLPKESVLATPVVIREYDLTTVTEEELQEVSAKVRVRLGSCVFHGVAFWFSVWVSSSSSSERGETLDTSPFVSPTHWKQTSIIYPTEIDFTDSSETDVGILVEITKQEKGSRGYEIEMQLVDPDE